MRTLLTPAPEFQPAAAQRRLLEFVLAHPEFKTVTQFCEAAEVLRSTYEDWCREPGFRAWFIREWSSALLFEGWHVLNLARANMVNSPVHFQALFQLLFSPTGQASLSEWAEHGARAPEDTWQTPAQALPAVVESKLLSAATAPERNEGGHDDPSLRTTPEQNQQVAAGLRKSGPPAAVQTLRQGIFGTCEARP